MRLLSINCSRPLSLRARSNCRLRIFNRTSARRWMQSRRKRARFSFLIQTIPRGTLISQRAIDSFMSRVPKNIVVVFDEAYFEFLDDPPDTLQYVREGRNVVVLAHVFENSWTGWSADRLWRRDRGFGRGPSQDEAAIQCEQHRASRRARGAGGRRAPARDEARDRRRPRLFAGTILRIEGSLCASHREFRDGKRGRWLCALRETAATANHRAAAQRLWLTRMGPDHRWRDGGE